MAVDLGSAHGRIELDTSGVEQGVQRATKSITGMGPKLRALGDKIAGVGATLSLKLTAPLVALGGAASVAAIRFESSFAGVRKTVDASEGEFAMLRDSILDMAWSMDDATAALPDAQNKLAGIMEMAGQLGVEGADNLENFTATIAKLTMATNLTAEGAATELARFANITQMSMEHIDELGSVIVALGNNSATTEAEIVGMAQRMAAAGNQAGMTEADIMAISAAMSSVGIAAEAGGTAISRVLFDIDTAVRSSGSGIVNNTERIGVAQEDLILLYDKLAKAQEGLATATTEAEQIKAQRVVDSVQTQIGALEQQLGWMEETNGQMASFSDEQLRRIAEIADMSTDAFADLWKDDSARALATFTEGLGALGDEGEDVAAVLEELGFSEIRVRDTLLRLAGAGDLVTASLDISEQAWKENVALQEEAAKRMETTEAQLNLLRNTLQGAAIILGDALLPVINEVLGAITPLVRRFAEGFKTFAQNNPEIVKLAAAFGAVLAAVGPVLVIVGKLISVIVAVVNPVSMVIAAIGALAFAFETNFLGIRDAIQPVINLIGGLGQVFGAAIQGLEAPIDALARIQIALSGIFGDETAARIVGRIKALADGIGSFLGDLKTRIEGAIGALGAGQSLGDVLMAFFNIDIGPLEQAWATLQNIWATFIQPVIDGIVGLVGDLLAGEPVGDALRENLGIDVGGLEAAWETMRRVWDDYIRPVLEQAWSRIVVFVQALQLGVPLRDALQHAFGIDISGLEAAWDTLARVWNDYIRPVLEEAWSRIVVFVATLTMGGSLKDALRSAFNIDISGIEEAWSTIARIWNDDIKPFVEEAAGKINAFITDISAGETLADALNQTFNIDISAAMSVIDTLWSGIVTWFDGVRANIDELIQTLSQNIDLGNFQNLIDLLVEVSKPVIAAVLASIWLGLSFVGGIISGLSAAVSPFLEFLDELGQFAGDALAGDWGGAFINLGEALWKLWDVVVQFVESSFEGFMDFLGVDDEQLHEIIGALEYFAGEIGRVLHGVFNSIKLGILTTLRDVINAIPEALRETLGISNDVITALDKEIADAARRTNAGYQAGVLIANETLRGIRSQGGSVGDSVAALTDGIKNAFIEGGPEAAQGFYQRIVETDPDPATTEAMQQQLADLMTLDLESTYQWAGADPAQQYVDEMVAAGMNPEAIQAAIDAAGLTDTLTVPTPEITFSEEELRASAQALASMVDSTLVEEFNAAAAAGEDTAGAAQALWDSVMAEPDMEQLLAWGAEMGPSALDAITQGVAQGLAERTEGVIDAAFWTAQSNTWYDDLMTALQAESPAQKFVPAGQAITEGVGHGAENPEPLNAALSSVVAAALSAAQALGQRFVSVGQAIVDGIGRGIDAKSAELMAKIQAIADEAARTMESALDIQSPSKVFQRIGELTAAGYAMGIDSMSPAIRGAVAGMAAPLPAHAGGRGGTVNHYDQRTQQTSNTTYFQPQYADRPSSHQMRADAEFVQQVVRARRR